MRNRKSWGTSWLRVGRAGLTGTLCAMMVVPPAMAEDGAGIPKGIPKEIHTAPLTQQEKVLQALNRLTFGPRPGDVAEVERMGLEKWFQMQLHPERIDDTAFEREMAQYPAMELSAPELRKRFPSAVTIRQISKGDVGLPGNPVEHAIYADALAAYQAKSCADGGSLACGVPRKVSVGVAVDAAKTVAGPTHDESCADGGSLACGGRKDSHPTHDDGAVMNAVPSPAAGGTLLSDGTVVLGETGAGGVVTGPTHDESCADGGGLACGGAMNSHPTHDDGAVMNGAPSSAVGGAGMVGSVLALEAQERVARLVAMRPEEMLAFREELRPRDREALFEGLNPSQRETVEALVEGPERVVAEEDMEMRLMRDVDSRRQLQAVMTEFWLNHFNVYLRKNEMEPYMLAEYEQDAILPHALGKFEDLLVATAKSPAMLMYLDNWESIGPDSVAASYADGGRLRVVGAQAGVASPTQDDKAVMNGAPTVVAGQSLKAKLPKGINENYGRELMELHTLGVGGGYTQRDVVEVAKCFTGWTIDRPYGGGGVMASGGRFRQMDQALPGEFVFEPNRHEPGSKVVLGHTIAEGGMNEGLEVLHILATSPATAHFISKELAVRFVSDTPPPALVDAMAATFLKSHGDIAAVLTTMFHAKEFWAPQVYRAKVKTPLEFMTSALRASDARVTNALPLVQAMNRLGMPVWGMQTPNGYGWTEEDWVSSNALISRMNFAVGLSGGKVPGTVMDWPGLLGGDEVASAETERELEGVLLGQPAGERTRQAVMAGDGARLDTMAGLLMGSPEFQRR